MRHRVRTSKLSRPKSARESMIISQAKTLLKNDKLVTTRAKMKVTVQFVDGLLAKVVKFDEIKALRYVEKALKDKEFAGFVVKELKPKFGKRTSGFIRVLKLENRKGDDAKMALGLLLIEKKDKKSKKKNENKSNKAK